MQKKRKSVGLVRVKEDTQEILDEVKARTGIPKTRFIADAVAEKWNRMIKEPA